MNGTYLCTKCGLIASANDVAVYQRKDKSWRLWYTVDCINESCDGQMFECDEEMIVPIKILNDKGYGTKFCCSGHLSILVIVFAVVISCSLIALILNRSQEAGTLTKRMPSYLTM